MISLDLNTIFLNYVFSNLVCLAVMLMLWFQTRKKFDGIGHVILNFLFQLIAMLLIFLRGNIPDFYTVLLANFLAIYGFYLAYVGLEKFVGLKSKKHFNYLYLTIFIIIHWYFTFITPNIEFRTINVSLILIFISLEGVWLMLYRTPKNLRNLTKNIALVFIAFALINFVRLLDIFTEKDFISPYFHSDELKVMVVISYHIVYLVFTFFMAIMINKRLMIEIEDHKQRYSMAFQSVPYAIIITRKHDGKVIESNKGFEQIFKFTTQEATGHTTIDLKIWANSGEREIFLKELETHGSITDMNFIFRKKTAELLIGQISCIAVEADNEECILSIINDITERKKAEDELHSSRELLKSLILNLQSEYDEHKINLASEIDNSLNQSLAALRFNIGTLSQNLKKNADIVPKDLIEMADISYRNIGTTIQNSLQLMGNLRNEALYLLGLVDAITIYIEDFRTKTNIKCEFSCDSDTIKTNKIQSTALFRIFQDVMNLILKHNVASFVSIQLNVENEKLFFNITENGNTFLKILDELEENKMVLILKERTSLLNGSFKITRNEQDFTLICIEVPLY